MWFVELFVVDLRRYLSYRLRNTADRSPVEIGPKAILYK